MLPASAVPVKVGVVSVVTLSLFDGPVSEPAVKSGAEGAAGALVSIATVIAADEGLVVDPTVAVAVMVSVP